MKSYLLTDNEETLIGLKLAGIEGEIVSDKEYLIKKVEALIEDETIGIIIITKKLKNMAFEEIMKYKIEAKNTLIVDIPSPSDEVEKDFITKYIKESIGLNI